jgi:hypothetical protein
MMGPAGGWLRWLEGMAVAVAMRESAWLYPTVETLHILAFIVLVGAAAMFDLRLLGLSRRVAVTGMAEHLLPWARAGLLVAAPTGVLMFMSDATATAANPAFRLKLVLIGVALLNVAVFHRWTFKSVRAWDCDAEAPIAARLAGGLSLALWATVVACGRLIAYV